MAQPIGRSSSDQSDLLMSKLPTREGSWCTLVLYKNYWLETPIAKNIMLLRETFKARRDDTILATNPKCGTTWLKALTFAITTRSRYSFADHPLLTCHPQELVPYIEMPMKGDLTYAETLPSPRLLTTHMPLSLLPKSIGDHGCRVVYISRDPKDAFVSWWHFKNGMHGQQFIDLDDAFDMFCQGFSSYGPFWDHALEYWKESTARPERVLFLKYEEMMSDPVKSVKRIAAFLGFPFTDEEEDGRVPEEVVRLCSFETLSSLKVNQIGEFFRSEDRVIDRSMFFRKGKVGDWVNHMSEEMGRKLDCIVEEKLDGSGLVF